MYQLQVKAPSQGLKKMISTDFDELINKYNDLKALSEKVDVYLNNADILAIRDVMD